MKKLVVSLILLGLFVTYVCYREISTPIMSSSSKIGNSVLLKKDGEFKFDIYADGSYFLEIIPIDSLTSENQKLVLSIKKQGIFSSFKKMNKEINQNSHIYYFSGNANTTYTVKIDELDANLVNKTSKTSLDEIGATASKNLYFTREFRPYYEKIFKIAGITTIILALCFVVLKLKYR